MKATTSFKRVLTVASLALAGLGLTSTVHAAQLTYDLRVVGSTAPGTNFSDPHNVAASTPGEVLTINLYALVQGSANQDLSDDGFITGQGSLHTTGLLTGSFRGDAAGGTTTSGLNNVAPFKVDNVTSSGTVSALDPDGFLDDLGSNSTGAPGQLNPWFYAFTDKNVINGGDAYFGTGTGAGPAEFLIGQFQFTISATAQSGQSLNLVFKPRVKVGGGAGTKILDSFVIDGARQDDNGDNLNIAEIGVNVLIPEPSAIGMLLLGSVGLVGFRRSAFRHLVG